MTIISILKKTDPNTPGALAEELAAARVQYESTRQDVISRGVQRVQEIDVLKAELDAEQTDLKEVVDSAKTP